MSDISASHRRRDTERRRESSRSASITDSRSHSQSRSQSDSQSAGTTPRQRAMAAQQSIEHMDEDVDVLPLPADAEELRQSFGDRKPPDITRKITACVACRKQKVAVHSRTIPIPYAYG